MLALGVCHAWPCPGQRKLLTQQLPGSAVDFSPDICTKLFLAIAQTQNTVAITHADSQVAVSTEFPARPGEFLQIFANGLGTLTPPVATGFPASGDVLSTTDSGVEATIGGVPAEVSFSGLAPGFVGLYQMNVRVPEITDGVAEVIVTVNGSASNPVTIQISNSAQ